MRSLGESLEQTKVRLLQASDPAEAPIHAWSMACGPDVLPHAQAVAFEDSRLIVLVESAEWKRELETLTGQYLKKLETLIKVPVRQIIFVISYEPVVAGRNA
jgi:hypothetical protein